MPRVPCPACDRILNVPDTAVGKSGSCPACKHRFTVPGGPASARAPAATAVEEPTPRPPARPKPPPLPDPRPARSEPRPGRSEPRKKKRKKARRPARRPDRRMLVVAAAVVGVVLVGGGLLVGGWLWLGGGGDSDSPAREPKANLQPGNPSTIYPHEFPAADPQTWKVAAEAADPPPAGLRPVIAAPAGALVPREAPAGRVGRKQPVAPGTDPLLLRGVVAFTFADPKAATAAVVFESHNDAVSRTRAQAWVQVSLTDPAGARVVPLTDGAAQKSWEVALSPSGDRLATAFSTGVVIWGHDGRKLGEWSEGERKDLTNADVQQGKLFIRGLWFASADRLLVLTPNALRCREVSTGKLVYERPLKLAGDAVLTPRRTWLLAGVASGVEAIATADGSTAGRLTIPDFRPAGGVRLAVSRDGTRLAALASCEFGVPLAVWTLADGKPAYTRFYDVQFKRGGEGRVALPLPLYWAGDRHLVIGGNAVYDLDVGGVTHEFVKRQPKGPDPGTTPDDRVWCLPGGGTFLTATAVPPLPTDGVICGPTTAYRVEVEGASGNAGVVRENLADALADRGTRVDPAAELTLQFEGGKVTKTRVGGKEVRNPKWDQRPPNGWVLVEMVDAYEVHYRVSIRDRQGRVLWQSNNLLSTTIDFEKKGKSVGWPRAAKEAAGNLPAGLVRLIPDAPPVNLPLKVVGRPDGTAEAVSDP